MLIYLDVETTGLEAEDRICAIGMIAEDGDKVTLHSDLVKPPRKIRPDAMAVHHITNEMVKGCAPLLESESGRRLEADNVVENIIVGHNIPFDLEMLNKEGLVWQGGVIDTLKCSRHLIEECEQYSLQFLRYELGLYKEEAKAASELGITLQAHTALSDALHVKLLYDYLRTMADDEKLLELTTEPVLITKFGFGKYKGRFIEEIAMNDRGYLEWMLGSMFDMDDDLRYSVEYYLRNI